MKAQPTWRRLSRVAAVGCVLAGVLGTTGFVRGGDAKTTGCKCRCCARNTGSKPAPDGATITVETGTRIKQPVKRSGMIVHSTSPMIVLDQEAIRRSGATTVGDLIRKRVPGAR